MLISQEKIRISFINKLMFSSNFQYCNTNMSTLQYMTHFDSFQHCYQYAYVYIISEQEHCSRSALTITFVSHRIHRSLAPVCIFNYPSSTFQTKHRQMFHCGFSLPLPQFKGVNKKTKSDAFTVCEYSLCNKHIQNGD